MTRSLGYHFQRQNVNGHGHRAALLAAALTRQVAAAVTVGTYWPWEPTVTLRQQARSARIVYSDG